MRRGVSKRGVGSMLEWGCGGRARESDVRL